MCGSCISVYGGWKSTSYVVPQVPKVLKQIRKLNFALLADDVRWERGSHSSDSGRLGKFEEDAYCYIILLIVDNRIYIFTVGLHVLICFTFLCVMTREKPKEREKKIHFGS